MFVVHQVHGLPLLYCHPKTEVYQFIIPDSQGLQQLLLEEAHCTPITGHMGVHKIISAIQ